MRIHSLFLAMCLGATSSISPATLRAADSLPDGFIYADKVPGLQFSLRYFGEDNFIGQRIPGYEANRLILTRAATAALTQVQLELEAIGLTLLVYDAYRPQRAVDEFVRWAADLEDVRMKKTFYPDVPKSGLIADGYIAARSSHSRGSAVDLTIASMEAGRPIPLEMGTSFDFFGPASWPSSPDVAAQARANRMLLRTLMSKHGFIPLEQEWWHYTLADEPFPNQVFDFPIR